MRIEDLALDVELVEPGDVIEQSECERVIGVRYADDPVAYSLGLLQLYNLVCRLLRDAGKRLTVTTADRQLNILTRQAASTYNAARFDAAVAASRRAHRRLTWVDVGQLTAEQRAQHDRQLIKQSRMLLGMQLNRQEPVEPTARPADPVRLSRLQSKPGGAGLEVVRGCREARDGAESSERESAAGLAGSGAAELAAGPAGRPDGVAEV